MPRRNRRSKAAILQARAKSGAYTDPNDAWMSMEEVEPLEPDIVCGDINIAEFMGVLLCRECAPEAPEPMLLGIQYAYYDSIVLAIMVV
jgi:hypothetical protein